MPIAKALAFVEQFTTEHIAGQGMPCGNAAHRGTDQGIQQVVTAEPCGHLRHGQKLDHQVGKQEHTRDNGNYRQEHGQCALDAGNGAGPCSDGCWVLHEPWFLYSRISLKGSGCSHETRAKRPGESQSVWKRPETPRSLQLGTVPEKKATFSCAPVAVVCPTVRSESMTLVKSGLRGCR